MTPTVDNVLSVFRRASVEQYRAGRNWYPYAYRHARILDRDVERSAGIIAALSMQQNWEYNLILAQRFYLQSGLTGGTLSEAIGKANRIYAGENPREVLLTSYRSQKTFNFFNNIIDPYADYVTVDRHAFDIAVGETTDDKTRKQLGRKGEYERFSDVYRAAATIFNIPPATMQAITWLVWRAEK
jgi:hypothetical protein